MFLKKDKFQADGGYRGGAYKKKRAEEYTVDSKAFFKKVLICEKLLVYC